MNEVRGEVWDDLRSQDYLPNLVTLRAQEGRSQNCIARTLKLEPVQACADLARNLRETLD